MTLRKIELPSRRQFLMTAASTAIPVVGGIARPYISLAAERPLITHGLQSGDVDIDCSRVERSRWCDRVMVQSTVLQDGPPVRAVSIPKKSGGQRILGVPTVADRVAQTVVKLLIEPILDSVFLADSY